MSKARRVAERVRGRVAEQYDLLDLEQVHFLWNHEPDEQGRWLEECFVALPHTTDSKEARALELNELSSSGGADTSGWPTSTDNNPGFYFGRVLGMNWLSDEEKIEAIAEFAKIRELQYAREILRGLAYQHQAFVETDGRLPIWEEIEDIERVEEFRDAIIAKIS